MSDVKHDMKKGIDNAADAAKKNPVAVKKQVKLPAAAAGNAPVAQARHAVMHDGAVRAGAGDGRERDVFRAGLTAERLERGDRVDLGQVPLRRFAIEPGEEFRHRGAVAALRAARAGDLDRILHRLH